MGLFSRRGLDRRCYVCGTAKGVTVWYGGVDEVAARRGKTERRRVYACPACFFQKPEGEREGWVRERTRPR